MTRDWRDEDGRFTDGHGLAALGGERKAALVRTDLRALLSDWPVLTDEASAKLRLSLLGDAASRGLLSGSQCGAAVRSVEVWLKARAVELDREAMHALEVRIAELETELAAARRG